MSKALHNLSQEKLSKWFEEEQKNGLVDIKFYPHSDRGTTLESFSKSVLNVLEAEAANKYSVIESI